MNTLKQVYKYFFAFNINFVFIILGCVCLCVCGGGGGGGDGVIKKNPSPSLHVLRRTNQCQCNYKIIEEPT